MGGLVSPLRRTWQMDLYRKKTLLNLPLTWLRWYFRGRFFRQLWVPRVWDRWFHVCHFYVPWCWVVEKKRLPRRVSTISAEMDHHLAEVLPADSAGSASAKWWSNVWDAGPHLNHRSAILPQSEDAMLHLEYSSATLLAQIYNLSWAYSHLSRHGIPTDIGPTKSQRQSRENYNNNNNNYVTGWKLNCVFSFTRACELGYPMFQVL